MNKRTGIVLAGLAGSCVAPLAHAQGMELTIYDPQLDPSRRCAEQLADLLVAALGAAP